jgi:undecaprenyl-diphosphatase
MEAQAARSTEDARPAADTVSAVTAVVRRPGPRRRVLVLAAGLTIAWAGLTAWVRWRAPGVPQVDESVHAWALAHRTPATEALARGVSRLGQTDVALPLVVLAGLAAAGSTRRFGRVRAAVLLLALGGLGVVVGLQLNRIVGRARPVPGDWAGAAGGFSFPSGHTTAATLAAGLAAWALSRHVGSRPLRVAVWVCAGCWALAVGWSRVWLGVHWPTDVLCAWLFAGSFLVAARAVQLTWWPGDAPPEPVLDPVPAPAS